MTATNGHHNQFNIEMIDLDKLDVWTNINVRTEEITADIDELAHSLDSIGLQHPIVVQKEGGRYKILVGQRRYLAAKQLGWETIIARVVENLDDTTAVLWSFSENVHRRELTARDKSNACKYLLDEFGTATAVAERIGYSEPTVRKWLGYFHIVPEAIKQMVDRRDISSSVALRIAENITEEDKAVAIAERIPKGRARGVKSARDRLLAAIEEDPEKPVSLIVRRAEELKLEKHITFVLAPRWAEPLELAARQLQKDESDIARDALTDWLTISRY